MLIIRRTCFVCAVALLAFVFGLLGTGGRVPLRAADKKITEDERLERIRWGSDFYKEYREIKYWGIARLFVGDFESGAGDAEHLKLVVKETQSKFPRAVPSSDLRQHFMAEFKRLFGDIPFNDLGRGEDQRFQKFRETNRDLLEENPAAFRERWQAEEEAYRRSLYVGRAGALYCDVEVHRRTFPVLYLMSCNVSAQDDLFHLAFRLSPDWDTAKVMGFGSPDNIAGIIKRSLTELLTQKSAELGKIRRYGPQQ